MACQICLEDFSDLITGTDLLQPRRVQQLCGDGSTCAIDVCSRCLLQHVQTTLNHCVRGMLPHVRCPICLMSISKRKWTQYARVISAVEAQYEQLAASALALLPACCHNVHYTHLPESNLMEASMETPVKFYTTTGWSDLSPAIQTLMNGFLDYRVAASRVIAFLADAQAMRNLEEVVEALLEQIYDDERRAALYLSYLYRFPATKTRCCGSDFCFNCKGLDCGDVCEERDGFQAVSCMVRCRQCRVMLVVTAGCDTVHCLCGFEMSWKEEVEYRAMVDRRLICVDIFDLELMETWEAKQTMLENHLKTHYSAFRSKQLTRLIRNHRSTLQRVLVVWKRWRQHTLKANRAAGASKCNEGESVDLGAVIETTD